MAFFFQMIFGILTTGKRIIFQIDKKIIFIKQFSFKKYEQIFFCPKLSSAVDGK